MTFVERYTKRKKCIDLIDPYLVSIANDWKLGQIKEERLDEILKPLEETCLNSINTKIKIIPVPVEGEYLGFEFQFDDE